MRKWYSVELPYQTPYERFAADLFKQWLKDSRIQAESSSAGNRVHLELLVNSAELVRANCALDALVYVEQQPAYA